MTTNQKLQQMKETEERNRCRFYRTCPFCGAHLDPGESCDCEKGGDQE